MAQTSVITRSSLRQLIERALRTDREAERRGTLWHTRCLHCRAHLTASADGEPLGSTTLEHIVPRSWFGRAAASDLTARVLSPDDVRNLALACARCNQGKGKGPDARGPSDARARQIVANLLDARAARLRGQDV